MDLNRSKCIYLGFTVKKINIDLEHGDLLPRSNFNLAGSTLISWV